MLFSTEESSCRGDRTEVGGQLGSRWHERDESRRDLRGELTLAMLTFPPSFRKQG